MRCERCNKEAKLTEVANKEGKKATKLCDECIKDVIRPNTNYQVKKSL